jgi:hypothetical protein
MEEIRCRMSQIIQTADAQGRVILPGFANATLLIEKVSDCEYRVRKAKVVPEDELRFHEADSQLQLSAQDAARVADALENPPAPNSAARRAAQRFRKLCSFHY